MISGGHLGQGGNLRPKSRVMSSSQALTVMVAGDSLALPRDGAQQVASSFVYSELLSKMLHSPGLPARVRTSVCGVRRTCPGLCLAHT